MKPRLSLQNKSPAHTLALPPELLEAELVSITEAKLEVLVPAGTRCCEQQASGNLTARGTWAQFLGATPLVHHSPTPTSDAAIPGSGRLFWADPGTQRPGPDRRATQWQRHPVTAAAQVARRAGPGSTRPSHPEQLAREQQPTLPSWAATRLWHTCTYMHVPLMNQVSAILFFLNQYTHIFPLFLYCSSKA